MADPGDAPRLIVLCGLPGAGKSRLAQELAASIGALVVSRDVLRAARDPGWQDATAQAAAFDALCDHVDAALRAGHAVIAEGMPFSRRTERDRLRAIARRQAAEHRLLWLDCPVALAQRRIGSDDHPARDRDALAVAMRFEAPQADEQARRIAADADPDAVLDAARRALAAPG